MVVHLVMGRWRMVRRLGMKMRKVVWLERRGGEGRRRVVMMTVHSTSGRRGMG